MRKMNAVLGAAVILIGLTGVRAFDNMVVRPLKLKPGEARIRGRDFKAAVTAFEHMQRMRGLPKGNKRIEHFTVYISHRGSDVLIQFVPDSDPVKDRSRLGGQTSFGMDVLFVIDPITFRVKEKGIEM